MLGHFHPGVPHGRWKSETAGRMKAARSDGLAFIGSARAAMPLFRLRDRQGPVLVLAGTRS